VKWRVRKRELWWRTPEIPALGRLRQEAHEFKASLGYIVRSFLNNNNNARSRWLTPVILLPTQEAEIRKITVHSKPA
jgi:hypothetical protein